MIIIFICFGSIKKKNFFILFKAHNNIIIRKEKTKICQEAY